MGTRLNGDIRHNIAVNAIRAQFDPRFKSIDAREIALAERIYKEFTTPAQRKVLQGMLDAKLPYVKLADPNVGKMYIVMSGGETMYLHCRPPVILGPYDAMQWKLYGHAELDKAAHALKRERWDVEQTKKKAWTALETTLKGVGTLEKLLERWPEGKNFYSCPPLAQPVTLPAVRFDTINQMLGLA